MTGRRENAPPANQLKDKTIFVAAGAGDRHRTRLDSHPAFAIANIALATIS
jgi:hypothetical protein